MKTILACEGISEVFLLKSLLKRGHLSCEGEIFLDEPIVARQLKKVLPLINALPLDEEINVFRIGDTQKDELSLKGLELRKKSIHLFAYCTKPELEILIIINEGLYHEYSKLAREVRPKEFVKQHFKGLSLEEYFETHDMYQAILEYKSLKKHRKGELYLADLLVPTKRLH